MAYLYEWESCWGVTIVWIPCRHQLRRCKATAFPEKALHYPVPNSNNILHLIRSSGRWRRLCDVVLVIISNWDLIPKNHNTCLLYTSPSPRDRTRSRMPSSA
eukprot:TRINITY_DN15849_c0_g1_i1.p1 TRINITY_DN15849_c0_g1~~TRINITY_DN15849_c0_g1_i1.p1  ORF type:complete len:102 (-),score=24.52 TRINITY_DN15849_c0_g1_i1:65-370(-)